MTRKFYATEKKIKLFYVSYKISAYIQIFVASQNLIFVDLH